MKVIATALPDVLILSRQFSVIRVGSFLRVSVKEFLMRRLGVMSILCKITTQNRRKEFYAASIIN